MGVKTEEKDGNYILNSLEKNNMEQVQVKLNNIERFDEIIKDSLPDGGDLEIITRDAGTESGRGIVMFTFSVEIDGKLRRAQTVTTMRNFRAIAFAITSTYDDDGFRVNMANPLDDGVITGEKE